jgi:diguanylate cyclase (GGDEF)-like protein
MKMAISPELILETINALIALLVLYLGLRIMLPMRLTLQRRSVYLFIAAAVLFALQEGLAVAAEIKLEPENLNLLPEVIETAFILCLMAGMYLVVKSETLEISVLHQSAEVDSLTKVYNIAFFRRAASRRIEQAKKYGLPLTLAMLDIDDFKQYNDRFGHEAGNTALRAIAQNLKEIARFDDLLARYGGEEFVTLMLSKPKSAEVAAERIRAGIETRCAPDQSGLFRQPITVSIGLASFSPALGTLEELIEEADKALYCAKKSGKNRVSTMDCQAGQQPESVIQQ